MAKAKVVSSPKVHLELSVEEAKWLRGYTQNSLSLYESLEEHDLRCAIFTALAESVLKVES